MKAEVGGGVEEAGAVWASGSHGKEPEIGLIFLEEQKESDFKHPAI